MISNTRQQLEDWLKGIEIYYEKVLDVGGTANSVVKRLKVWKGDYSSLDIKPEATYVRDINLPINNVPQFDTIFCLEVMEYVWNPVQALENINRMLKTGGKLYISFHFLFPHHDPSNRDYLRYTRDGVIKLLQETGFNTMYIKPRIAKDPVLLKKWCDSESEVVRGEGWIGFLAKATKK